MAASHAISLFSPVDFDINDENGIAVLQRDTMIPSNISDVETRFLNAFQNIFGNQVDMIHSNVGSELKNIKKIPVVKIQDILSKYNNQVLSFFYDPANPACYGTTAESLCKKYRTIDTGEDTLYNNDINNDLKLDNAMDVVVSDINNELKERGTCISDFTNLLNWISSQCIDYGKKSVELEKCLEIKLGKIDDINKNIALFSKMNENEHSPEMKVVLEKYVAKEFEDLKIEGLYNDLIKTYKKWKLYRELFRFQAAHSSCDTPAPTCAICLSEKITHAIVPCGHTACSSCITKVYRKCHICRGTTNRTIRLYFN